MTNLLPDEDSIGKDSTFGVTLLGRCLKGNLILEPPPPWRSPTILGQSRTLGLDEDWGRTNFWGDEEDEFSRWGSICSFFLARLKANRLSKQNPNNRPNYPSGFTNTSQSCIDAYMHFLYQPDCIKGLQVRGVSSSTPSTVPILNLPSSIRRRPAGKTMKLVTPRRTDRA